MSKYIAIILSIFIARHAVAQIQPQEQGSSVQFKIKNLGFNVTGTLTGLAGKIHFDPAHPDDAAFDVTVNSTTINTDNSMRDDHLRGDTYFNVTKYPVVRIASTKIVQQRKGVYLFTGQLTIKDHTKEISFPFSATESGGGALRFQGSFTINRKDFEIGGFSTISNELEVTLDVIAK